MTVALNAGWQGGDGACRLLALVGPPGSAKSTMVRLLAQDMDVELAEWQVWKKTNATRSGENASRRRLCRVAGGSGMRRLAGALTSQGLTPRLKRCRHRMPRHVSFVAYDLLMTLRSSFYPPPPPDPLLINQDTSGQGGPTYRPIADGPALGGERPRHELGSSYQSAIDSFEEFMKRCHTRMTGCIG